MTSDQEHNLFKEFSSIEEDILFSKASDYANHDVLSNFKKVANVLDITPQQYCVQMITTKIVRLANLIGSDKSPKHESIQDSIHDLRNYAFLLGCILEESRHKSDSIAKEVFTSDFSKFQQKQAILDEKITEDALETFPKSRLPEPGVYSDSPLVESSSAEDISGECTDDQQQDNYNPDDAWFNSVRKLTA